MNIDDRMRQLGENTTTGTLSTEAPSLDQITRRAPRSRTRDRAAFAAVGLALLTVTSVSVVRTAGTGQRVNMPVAAATGTTGQGGGSPGDLASPMAATAMVECATLVAPSVGSANGTVVVPVPMPSTSISGVGDAQPGSAQGFAGGSVEGSTGTTEVLSAGPDGVTIFIGPDGQTAPGSPGLSGDLPDFGSPSTTRPSADVEPGTPIAEPTGPIPLPAPGGNDPVAGQPMAPCPPGSSGVPFPGTGIDCLSAFNSGLVFVPDGAAPGGAAPGGAAPGGAEPGGAGTSTQGTISSVDGVSSDSPISSDPAAFPCSALLLSPTNPDGSPNLAYLRTRPAGDGPTFLFTPPSNFSIPGVSAFNATSSGPLSSSCPDTPAVPVPPPAPVPSSTTPSGLTIGTAINSAIGEPQVAMACIGSSIELFWGPFAEDAGLEYLFGPKSLFAIMAESVGAPSGSEVDDSLTVERRCGRQSSENCFSVVRWLRTDGTRMMLVDSGRLLSDQALIALVPTVRRADAPLPAAGAAPSN